MCAVEWELVWELAYFGLHLDTKKWGRVCVLDANVLYLEQKRMRSHRANRRLSQDQDPKENPHKLVRKTNPFLMLSRNDAGKVVAES
jgi:hypothetical protein